MKLNTAPVIYHFPPNEGELSKPESKKDPMKFDKYDIQKYFFFKIILEYIFCSL